MVGLSLERGGERYVAIMMRITGEHFESMKKQTVTQSLDTTPHIPIQLSASRECNFHAGIESGSC